MCKLESRIEADLSGFGRAPSDGTYCNFVTVIRGRKLFLLSRWQDKPELFMHNFAAFLGSNLPTRLMGADYST